MTPATKISLFAQPSDFEPVLKVEPRIYPAFKPEDEGRSVHLNDIGKAAWLAGLKLFTQVTLRLESYASDGHEWTITMSTPSLTLIMRCVEYRKGLVLPRRNPRNFAMILEFQAGQIVITHFVQRLIAQLGRTPLEMSSWEEFTASFGVSMKDVEAQWMYLLEMNIRDSLRALYDEVKKEVDKAESEGLQVAEQARNLMVQAEGAIVEEDYDLTISVLETARGMINDARSVAKQEEIRKEMSADMIYYVQTIIIKAANSGLDTSNAQKLLSSAAEAFEKQDREAATRFAMQARSLIELESHKWEKARAALAATRSLIDDARAAGLEAGALLQLQEKAEKALAGHSYGVVQHYATTIRKAASRLKEEQQHQLDKKGLSAAAAEAAPKVMEHAREPAEAPPPSAEEAMRVYSEAMDTVQLATTMLKDARAFIDIKKVEPFLERAWAALKENRFAEAVNDAILSRDMIEVAEVEAEPRVEVQIKTRSLKPGIWNRVLLDLVNSGEAHARNISLKFTGLVEATRLRKIHFLRSGEGYTLEIGLKPAGAGELAYDIEVSCARAFDGVGYATKSHRWLKVGMETQGEASPPEEERGEREAKAAPEEEDTGGTEMEEVYVVFHDGRLIFHAAPNPRESRDEMSLSSLLTAVQEFIKDSFKSESAGLGKLEFGRRKMVLEHGRLIYIAAVLTGREPPGLRARMRELLTHIENERFDKSGIWDGNISELEDLHDSVLRLFDIKPAAGAEPEKKAAAAAGPEKNAAGEGAPGKTPEEKAGPGKEPAGEGEPGKTPEEMAAPGKEPAGEGAPEKGPAGEGEPGNGPKEDAGAPKTP